MVRRYGYKAVSTRCSGDGDAADNTTAAGANVNIYAEDYYRIEQEMLSNPQSGVYLSASDFHKLYTGYDTELLLGVMSNEILKKHEYEVKLFPTASAALYGLRMEECDFSLSGLVHLGSAADQEGCTDGTRIDGTAYLQYEGSCPAAELSEVPTLDNVCCLAFSRWYKREGPAVLSIQIPKVSRAVLFFSNVSNAESIQVLCAVFLSLLLSGHLVWYFERRANSLQFPMDYGTGVDHGLWWSVVTMTTVGYGDKAPVTLLGRLLGVTWMFIGVLLVGYFSSMMLEGYIDPPPRFHDYTSWLDLKRLGPNDKPFCTQTDPFFMSTLKQQGLIPSEIYPDVPETVIFLPSLAECYDRLLDSAVKGVIANKPRLLFDSENSGINFLSPINMCEDLVVSPVIEPVYHSIAVRRGSTDPADFSKNLKCSLDAALQEFDDSATLFSRPDNTNGPSYASIDAQQNWFRGFQSEDTNLFFTSEANRSETVRSWMLLCGTVVAYAFMFVALMMARYRKNRLVKNQSLKSRFRSEMPLKMGSRYSDDGFDRPGETVTDVYPEMLDDGDGSPQDGPMMGARLNDDRLMTMCEQLSDLRVLVKRIENMHAGVANDDEAEMRHAKYREVTYSNPRRRPQSNAQGEHSDLHSPQGE